MEILNKEIIEEQRNNIKRKKYRKALTQIQKTIDKTESLQAEFIFSLLIIQQKAITKLLNKNIFKKQSYIYSKIFFMMKLVNRNITLLLELVTTALKQNTKYSSKQTSKPNDILNEDARIIFQKIVDIDTFRCSIQKFFQSLFLVIVATVNNLKRYDAYQQAYHTAKFCYELVNTIYFPKNILLNCKIIQIKMIYGCILFQLQDYQKVVEVQNQVVDNVMEILCSNTFVCLKNTQQKKVLGEKLWKKLIIAIMISLRSSIHAKNYFLIIELYKLFSSAVKDTSRVQNIIFRKCTTYVLDSIGVILKQYIQVMDEVKQISCDLFPKLEEACQQQKNKEQSLQVLDTSYQKINFPGQQNQQKQKFTISTTKQKTRLMKSFIEKDTSFETPSRWKDKTSFNTLQSTILSFNAISQNIDSVLKHKRKNTSKLKIQSNKIVQPQFPNDTRKSEETCKRKNNQYSSIIKKQFQLKYRQSKIIQSNQESFVNIAEVKRNIKQASKFIEVSMADVVKPSSSNHNSIYFDNEQDYRESGIPLFIKTILHHKQFLGINKLFEKHEMVNKKKQNINKKKIQKKHKCMSSRRTSKFQDAQLKTLLRGSFTNYVSNPRSRRPRNIRQSVGAIRSNKNSQTQVKIIRRPLAQVKPNQYASKLQKLIDFNYAKSQQIIKKFSSGIQNQIQADQIPKQKSFYKTRNNNSLLSEKFYKLGKTVANQQLFG